VTEAAGKPVDRGEPGQLNDDGTVEFHSQAVFDTGVIPDPMCGGHRRGRDRGPGVVPCHTTPPAEGEKAAKTDTPGRIPG
jgi:hypothetical protein